MEVIAKIYLVKDNHGNKTFGVVEEICDTVQICGMLDNNWNPLYFESEAYHLHGWCEEHGLTLKVIEFNNDFDELWEKV